MQKNVASQKLIVFAFDVTTNLPKTGDAGQITAYVSIDYGAVTVLTDTSATEMDSTNAKGYYLFDLTQAETNGNTLLFSAKSSTGSIVVVGAPAVVQTVPAAFVLAGGASGGFLISGSNSGTTTFGALTVTGATTHTGNVVLSDGLTVAAPSTADRAGIDVTGNGAGQGVIITGGSTGAGMQVNGGSGGRDALELQATGGGVAFYCSGGTTGWAALLNGGSNAGTTNPAVEIRNTTGNADGMKITGFGTGVDLRANITGNITGNLSGLVGVSSVAVRVGVSTITVPVGVSSASVNLGVSTVAVLTGVSTLSVPVGVSSASVNLGVSTLATTVSSVTGVTGVLAESYRANTSTGTLAQLMYEVVAHMGEVAFTTTTKQLNKLDHSTAAATYTIDSSTAPTSITRAT